MLHLSLLTLPRRSSRWQILQPYELHQIIWKGFPDIPRGTGETHFLFRHDERDDRHSVLVQSERRPDWSAIGEGDHVAEVKEFDPLRIEPGTRLRFFVRANPVVKRRGFDGEKTTRHIAVGSDRKRQAVMLGIPENKVPSREEQLLDWLRRKGEEGGFEVVDATVGPNRDLVVRRAGAKGAPMTFTTVDFDGILTVRDSEAFARCMRSGIGRGKGFGLGLLSVKRA